MQSTVPAIILIRYLVKSGIFFREKFKNTYTVSFVSRAFFNFTRIALKALRRDPFLFLFVFFF